MKAMVLTRTGQIHKNREPLKLLDRSRPIPDDNEVLIKVSACGVCHTELDEIEGRTPPPYLPIIPGHQVVGLVEQCGAGVRHFLEGDRVGVAWFYDACGKCSFCQSGKENLCTDFKATGRDTDGGYAQFMKAPVTSVFSIPESFSDAEAAPLLCAGAIGYRSLRLTDLKDGQTLGLTGFGASGHLVLLMAQHRFPRSAVVVFARSAKQRAFARSLGADWAGTSTDVSPLKPDAVIDTTPAWQPIISALENLKPGGRLVINAIRKEENDKERLLQLDYSRHLWMEKEIKSVANIGRSDVVEFLALATEAHIKPEIESYGLEEANDALIDLKFGKNQGAKVLQMV